MPIIPPRAGAYLYDTHVHTAEVSPCAQVPAEEVVRLHRKAGYAGIVVTDHYNDWALESFGLKSWARIVDRYLSGYQAAKAEGDRIGLDVLPGMELTITTNGYSDFLVYGLEPDFLYNYPYLFRLGLAKFRALVAPLGVYVVQAHPFRSGCATADPRLIDAVEVYNGGNEPQDNPPAKAFARRNGLRETSGTDFHHETSLGRGGIWLPERVGDAGALVRLLRSDLAFDLRESIP